MDNLLHGAAVLNGDDWQAMSHRLEYCKAKRFLPRGMREYVEGRQDLRNVRSLAEKVHLMPDAELVSESMQGVFCRFASQIILSDQQQLESWI
jgi:hypothetical protein